MFRFVPRIAVVLLLVLAGAVAPAVAQPTAKEIAARAQEAKFATDLVTIAKKGKQLAKVTPAILPKEITLEDLAKGRIIARVETSGVGPFPDGDCPIYMFKIDGEFQAVAVQGGKIVARSKLVKIATVNEAIPKPRVEIGSLKVDYTIRAKGHTFHIHMEW